MQNKHLHIVSFNVPYPADYGGVIDVFYKIKALSGLGVKIHLHCFQYGREEADVLNKLCERVYYYPRSTGLKGFSLKQPYIVSSRRADKLLERLQKHEYPILFEGLHTCAYLNAPELQQRTKVVRMHNVEWQYYRQLAVQDKRCFKRSYLYWESLLLRHFEKKLNFADRILAISPNEADYFKKRYQNAAYLPAFHPHEQVAVKTGKGSYALYHGNLEVAENAHAVRFLVEKVFAGLQTQFIVAGRGPSENLKSYLNKKNIQLIEDPSEEALKELIQNAQVHVLPAFQGTGIKLKLLNVLFNGRFCIANLSMVAGTGLEELCIVKERAEKIKLAVKELMQKDFTAAEAARRKKVLEQAFNNTKNAEKLLKLIFED